MRRALRHLDAAIGRVSGGTLVDHFYEEALEGLSTRMGRVAGSWGSCCARGRDRLRARWRANGIPPTLSETLTRWQSAPSARLPQVSSCLKAGNGTRRHQVRRHFPSEAPTVSVRSARRLIARKQSGDDVVAVVSAMGHVTTSSSNSPAK